VRRLLRVLRRWRERLKQALFLELSPRFDFIEAAAHSALKDRLAAEDSPDKIAVVIGRSSSLAHALGVRSARLLVLEYPEFTVENLALLSESYDFVIADRALHRCESLDDVASETLRVLRPGGWFVHTSSILDLTFGLRWDRRRRSASALRRLFSAGSTEQSAGRAVGGLLSWIVGRKSHSKEVRIPTVETIQPGRRWYPRLAQRPGAKVGVVAIARNEAPYLLEWIAHYRVLGFDRIVIYDNDSNDASWRILTPLARAGEIEAVHWHVRPGVHKQESAYAHALQRLRDELEWCLIVDLDEFVMLDEGTGIGDILPSDPAIGAVALSWRVFGSAGHLQRAPGLTIERFTKCEPTNEGTIKCLVRPRDVLHMRTHFPQLAHSRIVDSLGNAVAPGNPVSPPLQGPARIHHYCTRSWEEFECKRARGRGGGAHGSRRDASLFAQMDRNHVSSTDALRLAPAVREKVEWLRRIVQG
jgi:SAM-dependent methyltransferase